MQRNWLGSRQGNRQGKCESKHVLSGGVSRNHRFSRLHRFYPHLDRPLWAFLVPLAFWSSAVVSGASAGAQIILADPIESRSLTANAFETGTLTPREGALPTGLWQGSQVPTLTFLLDQVPTRPALPAIGQTARLVLLSPGDRPQGLSGAQINELGGRKLLALVNAGFIDEARTVASLSDAPRNDPATGKALALVDLLNGQTDNACARGAAIATSRDDAFWVKLRTFCYTMTGERDAADLTYGLLRDRGLLTARDETFLGAAVLGVAPLKPLRPKTALELAIVRQLNTPLTSLDLDADGAVIRSVARDTTINPASRIVAARTGVAIGIMSAEEFGSILASIEISPEQAGAPTTALRQQAQNPLTDAIVYQAVSRMTAPEFLRDKAALIADALANANRVGTGFDQQFSTNLLYADEVDQLEGAIIEPEHAGYYARARLAAGDGPGAGRWLRAMKGEGDITALGAQLTQTYIDLTGYLSLLDPVTAQIVAQNASIDLAQAVSDIVDPSALNNAAHEGAGPAKSSDQVAIVRAVFDAAMPSSGATKGAVSGLEGQKQQIGKKQGQAALAALAMASHDQLSPIETVVLEQAIAIAGLDAMQAQLKLQTAWRAMTRHTVRPSPTGQPVAQPAGATDDGLTPSLKPRKNN